MANFYIRFLEQLALEREASYTSEVLKTREMAAQRPQSLTVGGGGGEVPWVRTELGGVTEAKSPTEPRAGPMNRSSRHRRFSEWHQEMLGRLVGCHLRQCSQLALPLVGVLINGLGS